MSNLACLATSTCASCRRSIGRSSRISIQRASAFVSPSVRPQPAFFRARQPPPPPRRRQVRSFLLSTNHHLQQQQRRQRWSSLTASSISLQEGDDVHVSINGEQLQGVVKEVRGSGWYAVQVQPPSTESSSNDSASPTGIVKVRSKQLSLIAPQSVKPTNTTTTTDNVDAVSSSTLPPPAQPPPSPPPPTIVDLDAALQSMHTGTDPVHDLLDMQYLQTCNHYATTVDKWIVFTDLHCAPSTLDTCLQVLRKVHSEALRVGSSSPPNNDTSTSTSTTGVLFLGDWWHHRATIRVDILNAVLRELRTWKVPMIMIPGNHDQVTLGGHNHALTPLEHSYRLPLVVDNGESSDTIKKRGAPEAPPAQKAPQVVHDGPLVFTHPTKFMNALFVPHIRDVAVMESVLSSTACKQASALFVHADVTGAYMNDLIVSLGGVSPSAFPPNIPIYSGHFHKPHIVKRGKADNDDAVIAIEYIGSPYQTSLAEAQQSKSLFVLDATRNWECVERIPLDIGRRHFKVNTCNELFALDVVSDNASSNEHGCDSVMVKSGDRVVVTMAKDELEESRRMAAGATPPGQVSAIDAHIETLRQAGVIVELREVPSLATRPLVQSRDEAVEEMTPQSTLGAFLVEQVQRESLKNATAEELLRAGLSLLEELEVSEELNGVLDANGNMTDLELDSVTLQGFGSFKDQVTYPLHDRGLVLVRGSNLDGGGDSNGSGKSSLAMATLWALTGSLDPRPMLDAKVSDVVNDDSKSARVSVRGSLNGKPFVITRTKTSTKGALVFHLDGNDLTTQSIKDTQAIIDENLGVGPEILARTMFHGQFAMNGLLEATDAKLKEELSLVVPLSRWQLGATLARSKSREASRNASEFEGMIRLRSSDVKELVLRRDEAEAKTVAKASALERLESKMKKEIDEIRNAAATEGNSDVEALQNELERASSSIQELQSQMDTIATERDSNLESIEANINDATIEIDEKRVKLQLRQRECDLALLQLESAKASLDETERKWNIDLSSEKNGDFSPPELCPTCQQPFSSSGQGHSHAEIQRIANDEIKGAIERLSDANELVKDTTLARDALAADFATKESTMTTLMESLKHARSTWVGKISSVERDLGAARNTQAHLSTQLTCAAKAMQQEAIIKDKETALLEEQRGVEAVQAAYRDLCTAVEESEARLQELRSSGEAQRSLSLTMTKLADVFGPRGIQIFLLQNAIDTLQSISQVYLDELSDCTQRLELKLDAGDRISRRAMIRGPDGDFVERPLSSLSGGQWRRCSLALSLGFADLVSKRGRMKTSLCVLDEPLTHLDRSGRNRVGALLKGLLAKDCKDDGDGRHPLSVTPLGMSISTILVILQDLAAEELEESFDHIDEVVKVNGLSTVSIDEES